MIGVFRSPTKAAAFRYPTRVISASRASLARSWNHRERAWWRRVHACQWMTSNRRRGRMVEGSEQSLDLQDRTPTGFVDTIRSGTMVYEERTGSGTGSQEVHPGV